MVPDAIDPYEIEVKRRQVARAEPRGISFAAYRRADKCSNVVRQLRALLAGA